MNDFAKPPENLSSIFYMDDIPDRDFPFGPIPHWIKCYDRLPEDGKYVLVYDGEFENVGCYNENFKTWNCMQWGFVDCITHWMPLPCPPKENDDTKS